MWIWRPGISVPQQIKTNLHGIILLLTKYQYTILQKCHSNRVFCIVWVAWHYTGYKVRLSGISDIILPHKIIQIAVNNSCTSRFTGWCLCFTRFQFTTLDVIKLTFIRLNVHDILVLMYTWNFLFLLNSHRCLRKIPIYYTV